MFEKSIVMLTQNNIELEDGLTEIELSLIEEIYIIQFPNSLKQFFMTILPVLKGFYNRRDTSRDNIDYIKKIINKPFKGIDDLAEEVFGCDDWGEEPDDVRELAKEVRKRLYNEPKLVPIYGHRYMPIINAKDIPIISVHGVDEKI